jgi:hypothetical protein
VNSSEQRKSVRYNVEIPLELKEGTGLTRNFSRDGIYFVTDQFLSVGERLEVKMLLEHDSLGQVWRLHCVGEVLRVEPTVEKIGVAFAITSQTFVDSVMMTQA